MTLAAGDGSSGTARLSGTLDVSGREVPLDSEVSVALEPADAPTSVRLAPTELPTVRGVSVGDDVFYDLPLPELPLGLTVTGVAVTPTGLQVTAGATDAAASF